MPLIFPTMGSNCLNSSVVKINLLFILALDFQFILFALLDCPLALHLTFLLLDALTRPGISFSKKRDWIIAMDTFMHLCTHTCVFGQGALRARVSVSSSASSLF